MAILASRSITSCFTTAAMGSYIAWCSFFIPPTEVLRFIQHTQYVSPSSDATLALELWSDCSTHVAIAASNHREHTRHAQPDTQVSGITFSTAVFEGFCYERPSPTLTRSIFFLITCNITCSNKTIEKDLTIITTPS